MELRCLNPFDIKHYPYQSEEITISRTGFTGDLGYEVLLPNSVALAFYDEMFDKGEIYNIKPCLLYTSPSPRDQRGSRMPSSA